MPPTKWMRTWPEYHPDWTYDIFGNDYLQNTTFETQKQINEYMRRGNYAGVADLMRYEILYERGGFLAEADSVCKKAIDELFNDEHNIYTVYENEFVRGQLVSPILAAEPGHPFLRGLIDELKRIPPEKLDIPWKQTGNLFVAQMIKEHQPHIRIWPSHYFIPEHYTGVKYQGMGTVYAEQRFGTTNKSYRAPNRVTKIMEWYRKKYRKMLKKRAKRSV